MFLEINRFMDPLVKTLGEGFSWMSELTIGSIILRLFLVIIFSGAIGVERASKRHEAGLRTYILVCIGAAFAMITNQFLFETFNTGDPGRVAAQVISGIGFLGAGSILITSRNEIKGLTTAAGLWASACLGISIGAGFYTLAIIGFVLIMIILSFLGPIEKVLTKHSRVHRFYVELDNSTDLKLLINYLRNLGIKLRTIEKNPAYANSGLSVYTIYIKETKEFEINEKFAELLKELDYVNHAEEMF